MVKKLISIVSCVLIMAGSVACSSGPVTSSKSNDDELAFFNKNTIKMVMPYGSGGTSDTVGRKFAEIANKYVKKPIVVENLTGGDGIVAATQFTNEKPDTNKIMFTSIGQYYAKNIKANVPFELSNIKPVSMLYKTNWILYVRTDSGIKNFKDMVEAGKNRKLKISVGGIGTDGHLTSCGLLKAAGAQAEPVMFEGGAEQIAAVLGGHVDAVVANPSLGLQYVKTGKLIPIASFGTEDYTGFEGMTVPSAKTLGYPGSAIAGNGMLSVRAGSDEATAKALRVLSEKVFADPDWIKWTKETMTEQNQLFDKDLTNFIDGQVVNAKAAAEALGILKK
jgi:tripartite-type tricarboxylate transporter receptor subunit TctC